MGLTIIKNGDNTVTFTDGSFINLSQTGGGIIGAFFAWALSNLVDLQGTYIILAVIGVFGLVLALNVSLADIFIKFINFFKGFGKGIKESNVFTVSEHDDSDEVIGESLHSNDDMFERREAFLRQQALEKEQVEVTPEPILIQNSTNGDYKLPGIDILNSIKRSTKKKFQLYFIFT